MEALTPRHRSRSRQGPCMQAALLAAACMHACTAPGCAHCSRAQHTPADMRPAHPPHYGSSHCPQGLLPSSGMVHARGSWGACMRAHRARLRPLRAVLLLRLRARLEVLILHGRVPPDGRAELAVAAGARDAARLHVRRDALLPAAHRHGHPAQPQEGSACLLRAAHAGVSCPHELCSHASSLDEAEPHCCLAAAHEQLHVARASPIC